MACTDRLRCSGIQCDKVSPFRNIYSIWKYWLGVSFRKIWRYQQLITSGKITEIASSNWTICGFCVERMNRLYHWKYNLLIGAEWERWTKICFTTAHYDTPQRGYCQHVAKGRHRVGITLDLYIVKLLHITSEHKQRWRAIVEIYNIYIPSADINFRGFLLCLRSPYTR